MVPQQRFATSHVHVWSPFRRSYEGMTATQSSHRCAQELDAVSLSGVRGVGCSGIRNLKHESPSASQDTTQQGTGMWLTTQERALACGAVWGVHHILRAHRGDNLDGRRSEQLRGCGARCTGGAPRQEPALVAVEPHGVWPHKARTRLKEAICAAERPAATRSACTGTVRQYTLQHAVTQLQQHTSTDGHCIL